MVINVAVITMSLPMVSLFFNKSFHRVILTEDKLCDIHIWGN